MKSANFKERLPEGYEEVYRIDAKSGRTVAALTAASLFMALVVIVPLLALTDIFSDAVNTGVGGLVAMSIAGIASILAYVVLHELVHGAAYKLLTGNKLTFGLTLAVAFCGVPDIYVTRRTALVALLSPFVLFGAVFAALTAWLYFTGSAYCLVLVVLTGMHFGGCAGDLYTAILLFVRYRDSRLLMRDTGPQQFFYVPGNTAGENDDV